MSESNDNDVGTAASSFKTLTQLLDNAVKATPRVKLAWGVVGIGAAAAIVNLILGLNRLAFIAILAMALGMILLLVITAIKVNSPVTTFAANTMTVTVVEAVAIFVSTSLFASIMCMPRTFIHIYGLQEACVEPIPRRLRVSNFKLFDEVHRQGIGATSILTQLTARPGTYFQVDEADKFALALGFLVRGVEARGTEIELELSIIGQAEPGTPPAWEQKITLYSLDEWKTKFRIPSTFGADAVFQLLGIKEGDGIPLAAILSCFKPSELSRWNGTIIISAYDSFANIGGRHSPIPLQIKIADPIKLAASQTCTQ